MHCLSIMFLIIFRGLMTATVKKMEISSVAYTSMEPLRAI